MGKGNQKTIGAVIGAVSVLIAIVVVFFVIQGSYAKPSYTFTGSSLSISGLYGTKIELSGATVSHELSGVPSSSEKVNGAAIGKVEKGRFKVSGTEEYRNILDNTAADYIVITDKSGAKYTINCASTKETDSLYADIESHTGSVK